MHLLEVILIMTFALNFIAGNVSGVEWSRPLMIGWIVVALVLSVIEVLRLTLVSNIKIKRTRGHAFSARRNELLRRRARVFSQGLSDEVRGRELPDWKRQPRATMRTTPRLRAGKAPQLAPNTTAQ